MNPKRPFPQVPQPVTWEDIVRELPMRECVEKVFIGVETNLRYGIDVPKAELLMIPCSPASPEL